MEQRRRPVSSISASGPPVTANPSRFTRPLAPRTGSSLANSVPIPAPPSTTISSTTNTNSDNLRSRYSTASASSVQTLRSEAQAAGKPSNLNDNTNPSLYPLESKKNDDTRQNVIQNVYGDEEGASGYQKRKEFDAVPSSQAAQSQVNKKMSAFRYAPLFMIALLPVLGILFAFGGRLTIMTMCLGSIATYAFDLAGSIDGTLMVMLLSVAMIWFTLLYASRHLLQSSIFNFHIVIIMGIILAYVYIIAASTFNSIRREFTDLLLASETLMCASIPLIASCVITWFLCIEVLDFDLSSVFTVVYFVYLHLLSSPRVASQALGTGTSTREGDKDNSSDDNGQRLVKPLTLHSTGLRFMVILLPVIISPLLYLAVYYPYLYDCFFIRTGGLYKYSGLFLSFLAPASLAVFSYEAFFPQYFHDSFKTDFWYNIQSLSVEAMKMAFVVCIAFCLDGHPMLDDLKDHSGYTRAVAFRYIMIIGMFVAIFISQYQRGSNRAMERRKAGVSVDNLSWGGMMSDINRAVGDLTIDDNRSYYQKMVYFVNGPAIPRLIATFCLAGAALMLAVFLRLPVKVYPMVFLASISMAEYYQRFRLIDTTKMSGFRGWYYCLLINALVSVSSTSSSIIAFFFYEQTIYFLDFDFVWFSFMRGNAGGDGVRGIGEDIGYANENDMDDGYRGIQNDNDRGSLSEDNTVIPMQVMCLFFSGLISTAVWLPTMAKPAKASQNVAKPTAPSTMGAIGSVNAFDGPNTDRFSNVWFSILFTVFNTIIVTLELLIRDQEWETYDLHAEIVYPFDIFITTSLLLVGVTAYLYFNMSIMTRDIALTILLIHIGKMLHLVELPFSAISACVLFFIAVSIPLSYSFEEQVNDGSTTPIVKEKEGQTSAAMAAVLEQSRKSGLPTDGLIERMDFLTCIFYSITGAAAVYQMRCYVLHIAYIYITSRAVSEVQLDFVAIALFGAFEAMLIQVTYMNDTNSNNTYKNIASSVQSIVLLITILFTLLGAEAFGPLTISIDPSSSTYLVIEQHPEMVVGQTDQSGLFLTLSFSLILLGGADIVPTRGRVAGTVYGLVLTYLVASFLLWYCFPHSLGKDDVHYGFLQLPSLYCYTVSLFTILTVQYSNLSLMRPRKLRKLGYKVSDGNPNAFSSYCSFCFVITVLTPCLAIAYAFLSGTMGSHLRGIIWAAIVSNCSICICLRAADALRDVADMRDSHSNNSSQVADGAYFTQAVEDGTTPTSLCVMTSALTCVWMVGITTVTPITHLDPELGVPLVSLLFLTTAQGSILEDTPGFVIVEAVCSLWWCLMSFNYLFIDGFGEEPLPADFMPSYGLFKNEVISYWTCNSIWLPLLNTIMALLPLPAIWMAMNRSKHDHEDICFVLALFSVISVIGGHADCIRYLGITGTLFGGWRCYDIGARNRSSDRLI
jgi:hypothetical protein